MGRKGILLMNRQMLTVLFTLIVIIMVLLMVYLMASNASWF
mgnify:CR=1 FL=1